MDEIWDNLKVSHVGLPSKLRPAQSDALHWLSQEKSVILCVGTGVAITWWSDALLLHKIWIQNHFIKITGSGKTLVALTNTLFCPDCKCDMCGWYSNKIYEFQGLCHSAFFLLSPSNSSVQRQELISPLQYAQIRFHSSRFANHGTYRTYPWMKWIRRISLKLWKTWTQSLVSYSAQSPLFLLCQCRHRSGVCLWKRFASTRCRYLCPDFWWSNHMYILQ